MGDDANEDAADCGDDANEEHSDASAHPGILIGNGDEKEGYIFFCIWYWAGTFFIKKNYIYIVDEKKNKTLCNTCVWKEWKIKNGCVIKITKKHF